MPPKKYLTLYHGTTRDKLNSIRQNGLQPPKSVASAGWPMLTESYEQAAGYINGKPDGVVLEYRVPVDKVYQRGRKDAVLWKPTESDTYGVTATEYAVRQPVPKSMLSVVHEESKKPVDPLLALLDGDTAPVTTDELLDLIGGNKFIDPKPAAPQPKRPTYLEHLLQTEDSSGNAHVIMPTDLVDRYREYDRAPGGKDYRSEYPDVLAAIKEQGIRQPLWISTDGKTAVLVEGNNRLAAAKELGIEEIPVRLTYDRETRRSDVTLGAKPVPLDPALKEWVRENRIEKDYRGKPVYGSDAFPDKRIGGVSLPQKPGKILYRGMGLDFQDEGMEQARAIMHPFLSDDPKVNTLERLFKDQQEGSFSDPNLGPIILEYMDSKHGGLGQHWTPDHAVANSWARGGGGNVKTVMVGEHYGGGESSFNPGWKHEKEVALDNHAEVRVREILVQDPRDFSWNNVLPKPVERTIGSAKPDRIGFSDMDTSVGLDSFEPPTKTRSPWSKSYANPRQQEKLLAHSPDMAYRKAVQDINHKVIEYVRDAYKSTPGFMTNQGEIDRLTALMAPVVAAGQMQVAQLTNAHLANLFGLEHVPVPELANLGRNGIDLKDELARPFWTAIKAARDGKPLDEALAAGEHRMDRMLATDMQIAKVKQSREALKANGIRTYQRVAGPKACWLCAIAATQTYYTEDLLPIHPGCGCDVAPAESQAVLDAKLNPEHVLSEDASQVKLMEPMVESDAAPAEYRDLIAVREHGETGPQLTWAHQKFTGPTDLPTPPSNEVLAQQVYDTVRENGGITIDLAGNQPPEGYAYAPYKTTEFKVPEAEFTPKHVDDYIDAHHKELSQPGNNLGMWTQDGYIFLDVSKVGPPTAATFAKAQAADQLAVFDLENFNEINLGTIDPTTKEYTRLGTPADLHTQYREQVARADEARRASGLAEVPGLEGGSRSGTRQPLRWTGPPVARPSYGGDIQGEVDLDWGAKKTYDKNKNAMRVAARKAQLEGYDGVPQHLRSLGRDNYVDDMVDMHGMEMVARAVHAAPTKRNLWRGIEVTPQQLNDLLGSTSISLPLSAFGRDADEARLFSTDLAGRIFRSSSVPAGATDSVLFKLQPGAKLAPIFYGHEYVGFGQFDVVSIKPAHWGTQGTGEYRKKIWRPTEITIKQTSLIEDMDQPIPGTSALKEKAQKAIPEFTVVGKKEPQFGTIDLKTGEINRSGDYITKVQPGPIPDYDNSYAVSKQLHARHPDLNVDLGSMIDGDLARSTAQELDDLMTKYPAAQLRSAKSRSPYNFQQSTRFAQTDVYDRKVLSGTEIQFNDSFYMKKADLERKYAKTTEIPEGKRYGYHPPVGKGNDAAKAIAAHEFGHTMDASGSYRAGAAVKDTLRREYLRLNPYTDEQRATDRALVANAAKRGITIRQPIETRYEAWLHDSLSEYSFTSGGKLNPAEALAESFGHGELDPHNITDAERVLHDLAVDMHTKPYKRDMVKPGWEMATPTKVVAEKENRRAKKAEAPPRPDGPFRDENGERFWSLDGKTYDYRMDYENALGHKMAQQQEARITARVGDVPLYLGEGVDAQAQKDIERTVTKLQKKYPNSGLREVITPRPDEYIGNRDLAWTSGSKTITLNPQYFGDSKALTEDAKRSSNVRRFNPHLPQGHSGAEQTIIHEFGHVLDYQGEEVTHRQASKQLKLAFLQDNPKMKSLAKTDPDKFKAAYQKWLEDGLSGYSFVGGHHGYNARLDMGEAIAEAFCDVEMNGDKASHAAHVLHDLVVKNSTDLESIARAKAAKLKKIQDSFAATGMYKKAPADTPAKVVAKKEKSRGAKYLADYQKKITKYAKDVEAQDKLRAKAELKKAKEEQKAREAADLKTPEGQIRKAREERDKQEARLAKGGNGSPTGKEEITRAAMDSERIKANRTALWEELSEEVKVEGKKWYPGEGNLLVDILDQYGAALADDPLRIEKVRGLGSAYSPQTKWDLSKIDVRAHLESLHMSQKDRIQYVVDARGGMHITENIIRADRVIAATTLEEIDLALRGAAEAKSHHFDNSRKIRHFFPNLNGDLDLLTADVWDGRAVRLSPDERRSLVNAELLEMNSRLKAPLPVEKVKQYGDGERVLKQHVVLADELADKANAAARAAGKKEPYLPPSGDMILYGYDIIEEATKAVVPDGYHVADVQAGMWIWVRGSG